MIAQFRGQIQENPVQYDGGDDESPERAIERVEKFERFVVFVFLQDGADTAHVEGRGEIDHFFTVRSQRYDLRCGGVTVIGL